MLNGNHAKPFQYMSQNGPIILVEDDPDDIEIYEMILDELGLKNRLLVFLNPVLALEYLRKMEEGPFLIICDINLPAMHGLEMREIIAENEELCRKSIPFIFMTTSASKSEVELAYEETVQGYFVKSDTYAGFKQQLAKILDYWTICLHPNMF
jgi:CheY-like chemotaxis protein